MTWHIGAATLDILTPFVAGLALALMLDPLVHWLKKWMPRNAAAGIIFLLVLLILIGTVALVVPVLVAQASALATNAPNFIATLRDHIMGFMHDHPKIGPIKTPQKWDALTNQLSTQGSALLQKYTGRAADYLLGSVSLVVDCILTLIIAFYFLIDLDRLRARLRYLAPAPWRVPMRRYSSDVGGVFADYLRGLLIVCALYGVATILVLYGMSIFRPGLAQYSLLVGVLAGFLYAVPYLGSASTMLITFLVAFATGGAGFGAVAIGLTILLNQVFDYVVTPRVVGGGVGLHPIISLFSLTLGGAMFGLTGLLLSVPVAASIQVILFRLYPTLKTPTPPDFLRREGVPADQETAAKVLEGDKPAKEEATRRDIS